MKMSFVDNIGFYQRRREKDYLSVIKIGFLNARTFLTTVHESSNVD